MPERLPSASLKTGAARAAAGIRAGSLGVVEAAGPCEVDTDAQIGGRSAGSVLAFDFGVKRIGVALGTQFAVGRPATSRALTTIDEDHNDTRFAAVAALIAEWQPLRLLVGRPSNEDGTPHEMTRLATKFGERLVRRFNLPVSYADERLTSLDAEARLRETGRNSKSAKPLLDAVAAQLILQTWFESAQHVIPTQPSA